MQTMLEKTGWSIEKLAREAGISSSTLTRFLKGEVKHILSTRTLQKLSMASGVPLSTVATAATEIDPLKLRQAWELAERAVGTARPRQTAIIAEIAAAAYQMLDEREKRGLPALSDNEIIPLVNVILRRYNHVNR